MAMHSVSSVSTGHSSPTERLMYSIMDSHYIQLMSEYKIQIQFLALKRTFSPPLVNPRPIEAHRQTLHKLSSLCPLKVMKRMLTLAAKQPFTPIGNETNCHFCERKTFVVLTVPFADKCEMPLKCCVIQSMQRALKTNQNRKKETKQSLRHGKKKKSFKICSYSNADH